MALPTWHLCDSKSHCQHGIIEKGPGAAAHWQACHPALSDYPQTSPVEISAVAGASELSGPASDGRGRPEPPSLN